MSRQRERSWQVAALILVGVLILAPPAGLALAQGTLAAQTTADITPTVPGLLNQTDTATPTETETATSTSTPDSDDNDTDEDTNKTDDGENTGNTLYVNDEGGIDDGVVSQSDPSCDNPEYATIQRAVDDANQSDTVRVCPGTYVESVTIPREKTDLTITARGSVTIEGLGQPAVQSNPSGVTIRGFDIQARQGADHAIVIGGQNTLIVNNTVTSRNGTGIFLSDGYTNQGERDPELGAATGSRILNNTVTAYDYRIWADADRTLIRNNNVTDLKGDHDPERRTCETNNCEGANHSIVSSGNNTVIRNNSIQYLNHPPTLYTALGSGILISLKEKRGTTATFSRGPKRGAWHDEANNNLVVDNSISNAPGNGFGGIGLLEGATGTVVRDNDLTGNLVGIRMFSNDTVIRDNTINRLGYGIPLPGIVVQGEARITGNTISLYGTGINILGTAEVINNTIQDNLNNGITVSYHDDYYTKVPSSARIINNNITDNDVGIRLSGCVDCGNSSTKQYQIHNNLILNNSDLGINNENKSYIVNATNNIWACRGPSSGANPLADPYTGRLANGSGDAISGGNGSRNGHPMSNVHFDPFQDLESCSSTTPTPTATPTPTPSSTPTSPPGQGGAGGDDGPGSGDGTGPEGDGAGNGDGDGGNSDAPNANADSNSDAGETSTPPATSSATSTVTPTATPPPTPTATATISPTPAVEPGFGVLTWLVGVATLLGVLAIRRQSGSDGNGSND